MMRATIELVLQGLGVTLRQVVHDMDAGRDLQLSNSAVRHMHERGSH
jgi:hypothetical protein